MRFRGYAIFINKSGIQEDVSKAKIVKLKQANPAFKIHTRSKHQVEFITHGQAQLYRKRTARRVMSVEIVSSSAQF